MVRRLVHALVIVLTLIVGAAAAAIIVTQTAWFKNWLRAYIVREAHQYLNGTLSIQRLGGNIFFGIEMENIGVSMDGTQVVAVKDLGLDYNVFELISRGLSVDNIRLDKPVIYLRRDGDTWSLSRLIRKEAFEADRSGPGRPVDIQDIGISDGSFVIEGPVGTSGVDVPKRFDHLDAKLSFKYQPVRYSIEISHVSFRGSDPAVALNALSGGVAVKDDTVFVDKLALRTAESSISIDGAVQHYLTKPNLNLQITSDKVSIPELARILPALAGVRLQPAFEAKFAGPFDALNVELNARSSAGDVGARVVADLVAPGQSVRGDVTVRHLDLSALLNDPKQKSDITASGRVDLHGDSLSNVDALHGTATVDSPRLVAAGYVAERIHASARIDGRHVAVDGRGNAYGASATAKGDVTLPQRRQPLTYDLRGRAQHVDLRKMPRQANVPPAATDVNAEYHAAGALSPRSAVTLDLRFDPSSVAGAKIAKGSTAGVTMNGKDVAYRADATVADLDLQRVGREFKVAGLTADRYKSSINGHVVADGRGTRIETMDVTARGELTNSSVLGGRLPQLTFDASLARDTAHIRATGGAEGFDPAALADRPALKGSVAGTFDVDATVANVSRGVTPDTVSGTVHANLQPSQIGDAAISRANVDADYHNSTADIRTLDVVGRDVNVQASGTLALNETGQSNLKLHADSPALDELGKLVDQPITGIGKVDATVTGNRRALQAKGTFVGDGVKVGENGALAISSDFTATVPDLSIEDGTIDANTHATFVTLAGQNINEVDGRTTYARRSLDFNLNAKQPQRSLAAAGLMLIHPDHQEVHLQKLTLQAAGNTWQLAPATTATINYAHDDVDVRDLRLVNGDQRIAADGRFGRPGDALKVTAENVDLASVDAMLLRPPQFTGRLNANGTVTGTKDAPGIDASFQIATGGFRQYRYDSFGGTLKYSGRGMTVDTKLQQNPTTFITAKGYVPTAMFAVRPAPERAAAHGAAVAPEDRVDLHIESTPVDLGIVQGFTSELQKVSGTFQANVDITGSAVDPHPVGEVTVQNAAFTVVSTGVAYNHLNGKIDLQPDKVHIDNISVLDNRQSALSVSGDLAVHERQLGGVQLYVTSRDFKVIDNKMGNVRVDSDLQIAGELAAPRLEGDLGVETGTINLDEILGEIGTSAYDTKQTEYAETPSDAQGQTTTPNPFDALAMNVHVTVPDDLLVKASDLRASPDAPIGLGAMTVTLGGDLRATKDPGRAIALVGAIDTVRGTYTFQGRRFDILRDGTIRFTGTPITELDPLLDIRARRVIQAVEARVNVRGTLSKPDIVLESTPPLEQADILSLIVFNQPVNELVEGQQMSLAARAQALAGGAITQELTQSIGSALNLDMFDINLAPENGAGPQLTIGQQFGQNLYVKVEQGLGEQSQTNFVLEYELTKWLRLQTNVLQGSSTQQQLFQRMQGSGVDLLFFFSY